MPLEAQLVHLVYLCEERRPITKTYNIGNEVPGL